jgi:hypothetical protein
MIKTQVRLKEMKVSINALLIALLVILIGSFAMVIIYGEVWRIRPLTTESSTSVENYDYGRSLTAFISSCICAASGASILYIIAKEFPEKEKVK